MCGAAEPLMISRFPATLTIFQRAALGSALPTLDSHPVRFYRVALKPFAENEDFDTSLISTFSNFATEACELTDFVKAMHCGKTFGGNTRQTRNTSMIAHSADNVVFWSQLVLGNGVEMSFVTRAWSHTGQQRNRLRALRYFGESRGFQRCTVLAFLAWR